MKTIEINIYEFSELSEKAKEKAREWYRDGWTCGWSSEWRSALEGFENAFPVDITNWSVNGRGEGVEWSFDFDHSIEYEALENLRLRTFILNNYSDTLYERKGQGKYDKRNDVWGYVRRSKIQIQETSCPFTGFCGDEDLLAPIREFIKNPSGIDFEQLLDECFDSWVNAYKADLNSIYEDEFCDQEIEANEYTFTEDGERFAY